jgi:hypothetical protein
MAKVHHNKGNRDLLNMTWRISNNIRVIHIGNHWDHHYRLIIKSRCSCVNWSTGRSVATLQLHDATVGWNVGPSTCRTVWYFRKCSRTSGSLSHIWASSANIILGFLGIFHPGKNWAKILPHDARTLLVQLWPTAAVTTESKPGQKRVGARTRTRGSKRRAGSKVGTPFKTILGPFLSSYHLHWVIITIWFFDFIVTGLFCPNLSRRWISNICNICEYQHIKIIVYLKGSKEGYSQNTGLYHIFRI